MLLLLLYAHFVIVGHILSLNYIMPLTTNS